MFGEAKRLKLSYDGRTDTNFIAPLGMHSLDCQRSKRTKRENKQNKTRSTLFSSFVCRHCQT